jgi:hypothetical protein
MTECGKEMDEQMKTILKLANDGIVIMKELGNAGEKFEAREILCVLIAMRHQALCKIGGNEIAESSAAELLSDLGGGEVQNQEGCDLLVTRLNDLFHGHDVANVTSAIEGMYMQVFRLCSEPSHADRNCNDAREVFRRSRSEVALKRAIDRGNLQPTAEC